MASQAPLLLRLVSSSVAVASRAGKIVKDIMRKGELGIVEKGKNDLQTEADRSAQRLIVSSLAKQFPDVVVIGEETLEDSSVHEDSLVTDQDESIMQLKCPDHLKDVKDDEIVVWVDPLDGTSEYTQGLLDHVTILIGIAVRGEAIAGVIHQPYFNYKVEPDTSKQGRTMWGIVGIGAEGISKSSPPDGQNIITTTRSHSNAIIKKAVDAMDPTDVLRVGGAGHKVILLIEGKAHCYVFPSAGCKKWDTCAPEAILHALGGKLTDIHGQSMKYHKDVAHANSGGVLATYIASRHQHYLSKVPEEARTSLSPKM